MTYKFIEPLVRAIKNDWPNAKIYIDDSKGVTDRSLYIILFPQYQSLLIISYRLTDKTFTANKVTLNPDADISKSLFEVGEKSKNKLHEKRFRCLTDSLYIESRENQGVKDYLSQPMSSDELLTYLIDVYKLTE